MLYILLAIAFERFAWYLMLGELAVWQGPGAVGNMLAAAYLLPLLGGWIGSRYTLRSTCAAGTALLVVGYLATASDARTVAFGAIALGCGLFKPCLSTLLGSLFESGPARSKAFGRYYAAINVGALPSTLVGSWLRLHYGLPYAFLASAAGAFLALCALAVGWRHLRGYTEQQAIDAALAVEAPAQWGRVAALCIGATAFFACFQEQSGTLVRWTSERLGMETPESVGTLNSVFVILLSLTPIAAWRSSLRTRLCLSCGMLGLAFIVLPHGVSGLVGWYALATVGEVLVSPLGMDLVSSLVPRRLASVAMSLWLLSMSAGGKLSGLLGGLPLDLAVKLSVGICLAGGIWFYLTVTPAKVAVQKECEA